jgi:hypothetical protein
MLARRPYATLTKRSVTKPARYYFLRPAEPRFPFALLRGTTYNLGQMPLPAALAFGAIPMTPSELRWELAGVAVGFILLSIGVAALALLLLELRCWSSSDAGRPQDDDITLLVLEVQ